MTLKYIIGYKMSARKMREHAGLDTLSDRLTTICKKFAPERAHSKRFSAWYEDCGKTDD